MNWKKYLVSALMGGLIPALIFASDLKVRIAKESDLSFTLSPLNFANSPKNFKNAIENFYNSPVKFSNSPGNFENSPSNPENGEKGNRQLIIGKGKHLLVAGYYVPGEDSLINFFSTEGKRLFYKPSETDAVFSGGDGAFCGTFATVDHERVLVLTEKGQEALSKEGIKLEMAAARLETQAYPGGPGHWIQENMDGGSVIILEDGSAWQIAPFDKTTALLWMSVAKISVITSMTGPPGYDYTLIHTDDGEKVHARFLGYQ